MKRIYPNEKYCVSCRLCEVACAVEHSQSKSVYKLRREMDTPIARTHVLERGPLSFSMQCRHCETASCLEACMTGAMHRGENGAVVCDTDRCIGCWMCVMACEFGVVDRDVVRGHVISKCDLCPNREIPACVEACPNRALLFEER